ncbi:DsbC family protein [Gammaproteobacteria bacterium AB-CW1]|uniref:Thiol:disulfide interchange protein n=1 Tax=Natronospira elongata TaxID=3110268 RepID=A0AAP6JEU1_9GAMM|nr:DsbC family protein [Gammaproteobacteria bacterium AB-CW1]
MFRRTSLSMTIAAIFLLGLSLSLPAAAGDREKIIEALQEHLPNLPIEESQLSRADVDGWWVLRVGPDIVYVDDSGEHLFQGDLIHLPSRDNLTERARADARRDVLAQVDPDSRISYPAENEQYSVTVFTDIDCGYCRQLHRDMDDLNEAGVTVHYLFYPRGGEQSPAWEKSDRVWCADDRNAAMDYAKSGGTPDSDVCDQTPTANHFQLGRQMQVTGTPAIITDSGHMIRGYLPVARMLDEIRSHEGDR